MRTRVSFRETLLTIALLCIMLTVLYLSATDVKTHVIVHYKDGTVKEFYGQVKDSLPIDYIYIIKNIDTNGKK